MYRNQNDRPILIPARTGHQPPSLERRRYGPTTTPPHGLALAVTVATAAAAALGAALRSAGS